MTMKRPDLHHSQTVKVSDVLARSQEPSPPPPQERDSDAELEEQRRRAREIDQLTALEVRLVGDKLRKQTEHTGKIVDLMRDMMQAAPITDAMREAIRESRDATLATSQSITIEMPQLLSLMVAELRELKELVRGIATVVMNKGTNGHSPDGDPT